MGRGSKFKTFEGQNLSVCLRGAGAATFEQRHVRRCKSDARFRTGLRHHYILDHGARSNPHPWHLPPLPTTFCGTRLLSRCFRRLRSRSFAQAMVERRGCTVCGGCASSSGAYQEVGTDGGPSRAVSIHSACHITNETPFFSFPTAPHLSFIGLG